MSLITKQFLLRCPLFLLFCAFSVGVAHAQMKEYQATWEGAKWLVDASHKHCILSHDIPRFGQVRFEQKDGRRLEFFVETTQAANSDSNAVIRVGAPPWKHYTDTKPLGSFATVQGKTPMRLPREPALRIYSELELGMQPVIAFSDWGGAKNLAKVSLSPVRFREVSAAFKACTAQLMYLDFEPIAENTVYFTTDSVSLNRSSRWTLETIARKYRKQKNFRVVLAGHADQRGNTDYNVELSQRRVGTAARFLRSRGVPATVIESRHFGETQPAMLKNTKKAWAKNRRVTIWLADS